MKTCHDCGVPKPLTEYWRSRVGRTCDGYRNQCKDCAKARRTDWATRNRPREAAYNRAKYEADPDAFKRRAADYEARKRAAFVESVDPLVVLERDDGACGICGGDVDPLVFDVDHIWPLAKGGPHSYANTQAAHPGCNAAKRDHVTE